MAAVVVQSGGASGDPTADTIIQAGIASGSGLGQAGNMLIAWLVFDNITATTPTITSVSMSTNGAENQGTWTKIASFDSPQAASRGGVRGELWAMTLNSTWNNTARWFNLSASTTCRLGGMIEVSGITGSTRAIVAGTTSVTSATPVVGDLVLGCVGTEANAVPAVDTDTTNGSWVTQLSFATTGGGSAANAGMLLQSKVVTASGSQTFNSTPSDGGTIMVVLAAAQNFTGTVGTSGSGTLTLSGAASFSVFSDDCSSTAAWNYTAGDAFAVAPSGTAIRTTSTGSGGFANTPMSAVYALSDSYFVCDVGAYSFASGQFWFGVDRSGSVYGFSVSNTGNWSTTNLATSTGFTPVGSMRFLALRHQSDTNMLSWYQSANGTTWSFIRQQAPAASVPPGGFTTQYLGVPAGGYLDIEGVNTGYTRLPWEVSLSGSGTLTPVGATPVTLGGSGTLTLAGKPSFTKTVALSGQGYQELEGGFPAVGLSTVVDGFATLDNWKSDAVTPPTLSGGRAYLTPGTQTGFVQGWMDYKSLVSTADGELIFQYNLATVGYSYIGVTFGDYGHPSSITVNLQPYAGAWVVSTELYQGRNSGSQSGLISAPRTGWIKFAQSSGQVTVASSPDRLTWTTITTSSASFVTAPYVLTVYGDSDETATEPVWVDNFNTVSYSGTVALSGGSTGGLRFFTSFGSPIAPGALVEGFSSGTVSTSGPWLPYYLNDFNPVITGGRLTFPVNAGYGEVDYYKTITTADGDVVFQYGNVGPDSTEVLYSGFNVSGGASSGARGYAFASVQSRPSTGVIRWATGIWDASATQYTFAYLNTGVSSGWWKFSQSGTAMTILHSVDRVTWTTVQTGATALSGATDRVFYLAADTLTTVDPWVDNINTVSYSGTVALSGSGQLKTGGGEPAITLNAWIEDFSTPLATHWYSPSSFGDLQVAGGRLTVAAVAGSGGEGYLRTLVDVTTNGSVTFQFHRSTAGAYNGSVIFELFEYGGAHTLDCELSYDGLVRLRKNSTGAEGTASVPDDGWARLTLASGIFTLEISTDRSAWTTVGSTTSPFQAPAVQGYVYLDNGELTDATWIDNINVAPAESHSGSVALSGSGALTFASVPTPIQTSALTGAGTLTLTGTPSTAGAFAPSGSGTLTTTSVVGTAGALSTAGAGTLTLTGSALYLGTVGLSGAGTLTFAAVPKPTGTLGTSGAGTLTLATVPKPQQSLPLTGTGTLTLSSVLSTTSGALATSGTGTVVFSAAKPGTAGTLAGTGTGTLTLAGVVGTAGSINLSGPGTLSGAAVLAVVGTTTLSGAGVLAPTGSPSITRQLPLAGSGSLTTSVGTLSTTGAAVLAGAGTLSFESTVASQVQLNGVGTLAPTGQPTTAGTTTLAGAGALTLSGTVLSSAAFAGTGALTQTGKPAVAGATSTTGAGTLTLAGTAAVSGSMPLGGNGTLTLSGVTKILNTLPLSGTGTLALSSTVATTGALGLSGSGALSGLSAAVTTSGALTLAGAGTLAGVQVGQSASGPVPLSGTGTLSLSASGAGFGTVTLAGSGTLTGTQLAATTSGPAALSGTGTLAPSSNPGLTGTAALSSTGTLALVGTPTVAGATPASGTGTLTTTAVATTSGSTTLSGTGTLAPSGTGSGFAQVTLAGSGTLVPSPVGMAVSGSLVLSGSGSTTVAGQPKTIASVALAGTGALATTGGQGITDTVGTSSTGTLALTGVAHYAGSAAFSGTGALTAESLASSGSDSTTLSGTGTLVLVGSAAVGGQLVLGGIGLLELAAQAFEHFIGAVTFDGTGLLESRIYDNQIDYTIVKVTAPESRLVAAGPFTRLNATAPRNNWTGSAPDNVGRR